MAKCAKCNKVVNTRNPGVQCNKCSKWFHGSCTSLSTEQLSALSTTDSVDWKCSRCATTSGGRPKRISVILPEVEDDDSDAEETPNQGKILQEIRKEVRNMREMVREIIKEELQNTLKFYSDKIDEYEEKLQDYSTRLKLTENQCKNMYNMCKNLELKNDVMEQKINKLEQARSCNNIEICGINEKEGEDLKQTVSLICQTLKQTPEDILKAYRKKKPSKAGSARAARAAIDAPIVVTLREGSRDAWLSAAKNTTISLRGLGYEVDDEKEPRVYVREALSPTISYLLWKTKQDLKEKSLCKYVWCKGGTIMVRKADGDKKIFYVRATGDIDIIRKELMKK